MKSSRIVLALFAVVALAQLTVATSQLWRSEWTLRTGKPYKFRTAPVDPYDAFRGRYVALAFEEREAPWEGKTHPKYRDNAYAVLGTDTDGFAKVLRVTPSPPDGDYLRVKTGHGGKSNMVSFSFSFDRFYMEERKAPEAERVYREQNRWGGTNRNTYALVRVRNGLGVIEDLFVGDKPIRELAVTGK
jgi:uncharacterized membrane-anchored protein